MQFKSQHKSSNSNQKKHILDLNQNSKINKQQNGNGHKSKYHYSRAFPPLANSPSYKKIPMNSNSIQHAQIDPPSLSNSNASRPRNSQSFVAVDRVVQLHERLKNLHLFYKTRIEDEKATTAQRNEVFIGIIEEMQRNHNQKLSQLRKMIEESHNEKKDIGIVDQRMNQIKGSIDEILKQSNDLKEGNQRLQREIEEKENILKQKEQDLAKLKEELIQSRNQLQTFQRLNLKQNKKNKEIVGIIEKTEKIFNKLHNQ